MIKQCESVIKNCLTCLRFSKTPIIEHPALAIRVNDVFDRIGIDLVFGLPETEEGYKGIMVITEYITKFLYAVPIKTKTANEVARNLFNFICLFGPPKELLSDQGKEFLNSVIEKMLKMTGIEH